ncbi:MAG: ATP-binding cassette domain-containing protein [Alphaproteobacteria bacterium]|nr:ATP-binding cassette domain-containing protein [Alphaproteobacteria bacterium]
MTDTEEKREGPDISYKDVARFTWHYWRPNKWLGVASAALMLSAVSMDAIVPVYSGKIIDALTNHTPGDTAAEHAAWMAFMGFTLVGLTNQILRVCSIYFWNRFATRNLSAIVKDGLQKVQRFSSDWHANTFAGGTVRKITRCMWSFDSFEDTLLMGLMPAITIMIGVMFMLSLKLPLVGLAAGVLIVLYCAVSIWMSLKILAPRFRDSAESDTKVGATLADIITGNPTVKAFGAEEREDALFGEVVKTWQKKSLFAWQTGVKADAVRSVMRLIMMATMISTTIFLWTQGKATPGDIVLVLTTFFIIGGYLRDIGMHISHLQRATSDMEDGIGFWLREDDVVNTDDATSLKVSGQRRRDLISFDKVGFAYPSTGKFIYRNMSVDIASGEKLALVGPSGGGKSTFVKLIQRLYNVTEGEIRIDGQDISKVRMDSLRQQIALVPQDPILFHRSLSENIAYGNPGATQEQIVEAAKKAYAHPFIGNLAKGYDTLVGERGVKLSGGERQRVAIARAILADAPILILDEATSSLDSISEHYIQMALEELMKGRTTITIAHRLSTIQKADRILVFDNGEIIEQGDHDSLMARPNSRYKALYEMQALELVPDLDEEGEEPRRQAAAAE